MRSWDDFDSETPEVVEEEISAPAARRSWDDFGTDDTESTNSEQDALDAARERQKKFTEEYERALAEGLHAEEASKRADLAIGGTGKQPHLGTSSGYYTEHGTTEWEIVEAAEKQFADWMGSAAKGTLTKAGEIVGNKALVTAGEAPAKFVGEVYGATVGKAEDKVLGLFGVTPDMPGYSFAKTAIDLAIGAYGDEVGGALLASIKRKGVPLNKVVDAVENPAKYLEVDDVPKPRGGVDSPPSGHLFEEVGGQLEIRQMGEGRVPGGASSTDFAEGFGGAKAKVTGQVKVGGSGKSVFETPTKPKSAFLEPEGALPTRSIEIPKHLQEVINKIDPSMPLTDVAKIALEAKSQSERVQESREMFAGKEAEPTPSKMYDAQGVFREGKPGEAFKDEGRKLASLGSTKQTPRQRQEIEWTEWAKTVDQDLLRKTAIEGLKQYQTERIVEVKPADQYADAETVKETIWDFSKAKEEDITALRKQVERDLSLEPSLRALLEAGDYRQAWAQSRSGEKWGPNSKNSDALYRRYTRNRKLAIAEIDKVMIGHLHAGHFSDLHETAGAIASFLDFIPLTDDVSLWVETLRRVQVSLSENATNNASDFHSLLPIAQLIDTLALDVIPDSILDHPQNGPRVKALVAELSPALKETQQLYDWVIDVVDGDRHRMGVIDLRVLNETTTLDDILVYGTVRQPLEDQELIEPSAASGTNIFDRMVGSYSRLGSDWDQYVTTGVVSAKEWNAVKKAVRRVTSTDFDGVLSTAIRQPGLYRKEILKTLSLRQDTAKQVPNVKALLGIVDALRQNLGIPATLLPISRFDSGHQASIGVAYSPIGLAFADRPLIFTAVTGLHEIFHALMFYAGGQKYGSRRLFAKFNVAPLNPHLANILNQRTEASGDKTLRDFLLQQMKQIIMLAHPGQRYADVNLVDYSGRPYGVPMNRVGMTQEQVANGSTNPNGELAEGLRWAAEWIYSGIDNAITRLIKANPHIHALASFAADTLIEQGGMAREVVTRLIPSIHEQQIQRAYQDRLSQRNRSWVHGKDNILEYFLPELSPADMRALAADEMDSFIMANAPPTLEELGLEVDTPAQGVQVYGPQDPGEQLQYSRPLQFGLDQMRGLLSEVASVLQKNPNEMSQQGVSNVRPWSTTSMGLRPALRKIFANLGDFREAKVKMAKVMGNSHLSAQEKAEQAFEILHLPLSNMTRDGLTELRSIVEPYALKNWLLTKSKDHPALFTAQQLLDARNPVAARVLQLFNESFTTAVPRQWQKLMMRTLRDSKVKVFYDTNGFLPFNQRGFEKFTDTWMKTTLSPHFMAARLKEKQFLSSTKNMLVNTKSYDWITALEWMVKNPWESMPMKGSVSPLIGNIIHFVKRDLPAQFTFAYQQLSYHRDNLVAFSVTEGLPRMTQLLGVKPGVTVEYPQPTKSEYMPRINLTKEVERLAEKGMSEMWEKVSSGGGLSRLALFKPKRGAAVSPKRTILDPKYALGRGIELAISARFRTEGMRVVARFPELVDKKPHVGWHPWTERGTPFSGLYVHPDAARMFTNQEMAVNAWVVGTRAISLIPRTMSTIANPVGHALNRMWAISTYFSETGQLASPKAYASWTSAVEHYWDELWELHMLPYDQVPETNLLKQLELRGLTRMHLGSDPLFSGLREEYTKHISEVAGKPIPVKAWRDKMPRLIGIVDWLKDHYIQHDKLAMYAIARQLIAKGVPSLEAIKRGREAVVNIDNAPKWAQWINHLGLSNFITWKMQSIPVVLKQLHRNPLTILNEYIITLAAGTILSALAGYAPTWGKQELLPPRLAEIGQKVEGVGFTPSTKGKILTTNVGDMFNRISIIEALYRNGPQGALRILENTPVDLASELIHNRDAQGRQMYDPALLEVESGRTHLAKYWGGKILRTYAGSTLNKLRKAALSSWNGGKDEYGNNVGLVGPWIDAVLGVKSFQLDQHNAGAAQIQYLEARISAIRAAKTRAGNNKFYQAKYGLDAEDAKLLAFEYDARVRELQEQVQQVRRVMK